jgi:hypothetical protein
MPFGIADPHRVEGVAFAQAVGSATAGAVVPVAEVGDPDPLGVSTSDPDVQPASANAIAAHAPASSERRVMIGPSSAPRVTRGTYRSAADASLDGREACTPTLDVEIEAPGRIR